MESTVRQWIESSRAKIQDSAFTATDPDDLERLQGDRDNGCST